MKNKINFNNKNVIKLLSLISAIILWSSVMSSENPSIETEISSIPVDFVHEEILSSKGLVILEPVEPMIKVRVFGKRNTINRTDWSKIKAKVDLSEVNMDNFTIPIEIDLPEGITLLKMSQEDLELTLDHYLTKRLAVTVEPIGEFPDSSLSVLETSLSPGQIQVSGAESHLDELEKVVISPDLSTVTGDMVLNEPISLLDEDGNEMDELKMSVDVTNFSIKLNKEKEVPIIYELTGTLEEDLTLVSEKLNMKKVAIKGHKKIVEEIEEVKAQDIDISLLKESTDISLNFNLPEGVSLVEKPVLSVVIEDTKDEEDETEKSFKVSQLNTINLSEDLVVEEEDFDFTIVVQGPEEELEKLDPEEIVLTCDLENLEAGSHEVKVTVELKNDKLSFGSVDPETVELNLVEKEP